MFKIAKAITDYTWKVTVGSADNGVIARQEFTATFKRLTQSEVDALMEKMRDGTVTDRQLADDVLIGWTGISDGDQTVDYSASKKTELLEIQGFAFGVARAFIESLSGARIKN